MAFGALAVGKGGGIITGIIMGGFLFLGVVFVGIAATVILSLISTFTSNQSIQPYGDQFACNPVMLKSLYTNTTNTFANGFITANPTLNTLCSTTLTNNGTSNVAGCVIDNHYGWGGFDDTNAQKRRRRAFGYTGLYSVSRTRIFFSTTCGEKSDRGKYSNNATSTCIKARLTAVNALFNNAAGANLTQWTPVSSLAYTIVNSSFTSYITIAINAVFGVPSTRASQLASFNNLTGLTSANASAFTPGCQYVGPISRSDIAAIIASQSTQTTTQPSSTSVNG